MTMRDEWTVPALLAAFDEHLRRRVACVARLRRRATPRRAADWKRTAPGYNTCVTRTENTKSISSSNWASTKSSQSKSRPTPPLRTRPLNTCAGYATSLATVS